MFFKPLPVFRVGYNHFLFSQYFGKISILKKEQVSFHNFYARKTFQIYIRGTCFYRCSLLDCLIESGRSRFFLWVYSTLFVCVCIYYISPSSHLVLSRWVRHMGLVTYVNSIHIFWELVLRFSSYNSSKLQILLYLYNPLCVDFIFYIFVFIIYFSDQVLGWFCRLLIIGFKCVCACCLA